MLLACQKSNVTEGVRQQGLLRLIGAYMMAYMIVVGREKKALWFSRQAIHDSCSDTVVSMRGTNPYGLRQSTVFVKLYIRSAYFILKTWLVTTEYMS